MDQLLGQNTVNGELTPELARYKAELTQARDNEISQVEASRSLYPWSEDAKQYMSKETLCARIRQKYTDLWIQALTNAGYLVRPMFESAETPSFAEWYDELNKIN
jgi:hypothetical protein